MHESKPPEDVSPESKAPFVKTRIATTCSHQTYSKRMPHIFDTDVVTAVLRHMNGDHTDDNTLIAQAFGPASDEAVTEAVMTSFDGDGGTWDVTRGGEVTVLRVPWPGGPIDERPAVRREVVALYDAACERLGVEPRPHA